MDTATWGQMACLVAALCWAFSVSYFRAPIARWGAVPVNFSKSLIAVTLLGLTALVSGQLAVLGEAPSSALWALVISGWIGLSLGDSALFQAVAKIGGHRTLLLQTLAPIVTAILAHLLFAETMPGRQLLGAVVILAGVAVVVAPAGEARSDLPASGVAWAVLAAICQGTGVALTKMGMASVPIFTAALLRQGAALLLLTLMAAAMGKLGSTLKLFGSGRSLRDLFVPSALSAYLGFSAAMAGVAWAPAALAAVLLATTPVFSLFLDAWLGEGAITWRGALGTLIAVGGVALLATA